MTSRIVELTRQAIRSWRQLAGLDNPGNVGRAPFDQEQRRVAVSA
jgi:hypothetical protein